MTTRSLHLPLPRRRRWRIALGAALVLAVYLAALSAVPALLGRGDSPGARREQARRAIHADNWGLVVPDDREALSRAVDDAWRALHSYQSRYITGTPDTLSSDRPETEARSSVVLDSQGWVLQQHDSSVITAASPASEGHDERLEGYRIRTAQPYLNAHGQRVADAEMIYQRSGEGVWTCERVATDAVPPPVPGLDFTGAGDGGFSEIDGHRVRGFVLASGAFGLQSLATVWIDTETFQIRRQQIASAMPDRNEVWTYGSFDEPAPISAPAGVPCQDS